MNEIKVTVVVGIYNSDRYLRNGLESIRKQTWSNLEVLMMDDGSTDKSGLICDEFEKRDKRFISVHKKNTGVCDSRNKGIEMATGEYICFMDGDDWFEEDFVEYMMKIIQKTNTSMACSDKIFTTDDREQTLEDSLEIWNSDKAISLIIYPYMILGPWNKIYSMKIINEYGIRFPAHWFGETLHFASTVAYYAKNVGVGHKKVYDYRLDNLKSGTTQFNVSTRLLSLDNATKLQDCVFAKNKKIRKAIDWHIHACYFTLIVNIIGSAERNIYDKEYRQAKKYLRKNGLKVFIQSEVTLSEKIRILARSFFVESYANHIVSRYMNRLKEIQLMESTDNEA